MVMIPSGASEAGDDRGDFGAAGVPEDFGFLFAAGFLGVLSFGLGAGGGAAGRKSGAKHGKTRQA